MLAGAEKLALTTALAGLAVLGSQVHRVLTCICVRVLPLLLLVLPCLHVRSVPWTKNWTITRQLRILRTTVHMFAFWSFGVVVFFLGAGGEGGGRARGVRISPSLR